MEDGIRQPLRGSRKASVAIAVALAFVCAVLLLAERDSGAATVRRPRTTTPTPVVAAETTPSAVPAQAVLAPAPVFAEAVDPAAAAVACPILMANRASTLATFNRDIAAGLATVAQRNSALAIEDAQIALWCGPLVASGA